MSILNVTDCNRLQFLKRYNDFLTVKVENIWFKAVEDTVCAERLVTFPVHEASNSCKSSKLVVYLTILPLSLLREHRLSH